MRPSTQARRCNIVVHAYVIEHAKELRRHADTLESNRYRKVEQGARERKREHVQHNCIRKGLVKRCCVDTNARVHHGVGIGRHHPDRSFRHGGYWCNVAGIRLLPCVVGHCCRRAVRTLFVVVKVAGTAHIRAAVRCRIQVSWACCEGGVQLATLKKCVLVQLARNFYIGEIFT